jgi:hypothetical protein
LGGRFCEGPQALGQIRNLQREFAIEGGGGRKSIPRDMAEEGKGPARKLSRIREQAQ